MVTVYLYIEGSQYLKFEYPNWLMIDGAYTAGDSSISVDINDSLGKSFRRFLWKIVSDASLDEAVLVFA